ncbi:hypothetical protein ASE67_02745 [Sphingomonas sp. Leaf23]|uniref:Lar family restriction alleviation protein n=1 Tax=Sphingomonas sp. Leaf23 TaxID=1735689 RepID=UPI0006FC5111|nr:hypothetical protein ASE67_02745 [Sphingomonas sp. Leaf23]
MSGGAPAGELLKTCPFCGGAARLDIGKQVFEDAEVSCVKCGCQGPNCDDGFGREDNSRLATCAWNTRATPTPPIEGRDADVERVELPGLATYWLLDSARILRSNGSDMHATEIEAVAAALQALGERG